MDRWIDRCDRLDRADTLERLDIFCRLDRLDGKDQDLTSRWIRSF